MKKLTGSAEFIRNARASVALVKKTDLKTEGDNFIINDKTVEERYLTCPDFRFSDKISVSFCSGILISPKVVLTAGHCMQRFESKTCEKTSFVFGYSQEIDKAEVKKIKKENVYNCEKILALNNFHGDSQLDYALVQLDRDVDNKDAIPLFAEQAKSIAAQEQIYTIGYPIGTTKKLSKGRVRDFSKETGLPLAALDIYFGNSGGLFLIP